MTWKEAVREWCKQEYGVFDEEQFESESKTMVSIAYTEDDDGYPIQVYIDCTTNRVWREVNFELDEETTIEPDGLKYWSFEDLVFGF